jgi:hypothetical protein
LKVLFWIQKILWVLLLILVLNPTEIILGQNLSSDEEYLSIIEKIKKGEDTETDYTKLRMLYAQTSFYQPESAERDENILKMTQAWIDKHDNEAIEIGNQLLEGEYLNPFVHDLFAKIYKESGEGDPLFHLLMFINIITSIQGDGKSYETAYQVISTWEEKAMMTFVRVSPVDQVFEPTLHDGHCYHVIQVKADETGEISDLYFNIDIPYQKAQQTGPVVTMPVITPITPTPALQPITTYTDPTGQFFIHFPVGFSLLASQTNLIQCMTPNNGNLYLIISDYGNTMKAFSDEIIKRPGAFSGESQFQAGNLSIGENSALYYVWVFSGSGWKKLCRSPRHLCWDRLWPGGGTSSRILFSCSKLALRPGNWGSIPARHPTTTSGFNSNCNSHFPGYKLSGIYCARWIIPSFTSRWIESRRGVAKYC